MATLSPSFGMDQWNHNRLQGGDPEGRLSEFEDVWEVKREGNLGKDWDRSRRVRAPSGKGKGSKRSFRGEDEIKAILSPEDSGTGNSSKKSRKSSSVGLISPKLPSGTKKSTKRRPDNSLKDSREQPLLESQIQKSPSKNNISFESLPVEELRRVLEGSGSVKSKKSNKAKQLRPLPSSVSPQSDDLYLRPTTKGEGSERGPKRGKGKRNTESERDTKKVFRKPVKKKEPKLREEQEIETIRLFHITGDTGEDTHSEKLRAVQNKLKEEYPNVVSVVCTGKDSLQGLDHRVEVHKRSIILEFLKSGTRDYDFFARHIFLICEVWTCLPYRTLWERRRELQEDNNEEEPLPPREGNQGVHPGAIFLCVRESSGASQPDYFRNEVQEVIRNIEMFASRSLLPSPPPPLKVSFLFPKRIPASLQAWGSVQPRSGRSFDAPEPQIDLGMGSLQLGAAWEEELLELVKSVKLAGGKRFPSRFSSKPSTAKLAGFGVREAGREDLGKRGVWTSQLMQVPNVSESAARSVVAEFPSMRSLLKSLWASPNARERVKAQIENLDHSGPRVAPSASGAYRRLGKALAAKIVDVFSAMR